MTVCECNSHLDFFCLEWLNLHMIQNLLQKNWEYLVSVNFRAEWYYVGVIGNLTINKAILRTKFPRDATRTNHAKRFNMFTLPWMHTQLCWSEEINGSLYLEIRYDLDPILLFTVPVTIFHNCISFYVENYQKWRYNWKYSMIHHLNVYNVKIYSIFLLLCRCDLF